MKKLLTLMLALSMLLTLCACGTANPAEPESSEETYYWRTEAVSRYPFGLDGTISAAAADGEHVFLCGIMDGAPCLARMDYTLDGGLRIGEAAVTALPEEGSPISLDCAAGRFLMLLGEEADGGMQYTVSAYLPDGSLTGTYPVSIDAGDEARSILALPDGGFWLRGAHNIRRYSASGEELESFTRERVEFCPPLLIDGEAVFQTIDTDSHRSKLNTYDAAAGKLIPVDCDIDLRALSAVCRSAAGEALVCMGGTLVSIGSDFSAARTVELDELYSAQTQYEEVLSLDENTYLLVPGKAETIPPENSGELICLTREWTIDNRRTVNIAFYGRASEMLAALKTQYMQLSPDHRVECLDYGADEEGLARLLRDVSTGEGIDLIVADGYSIDTAAGFTDLYPFLDADPELSRESFVPGLLSGIERNGRLGEIWSGFSICTFVSDGALRDKPGALRLSECQTYLDSAGSTEPLFNGWMTKMELLRCMTPGIFARGTAALESDGVRALLEICAARPAEVDTEETGSPELMYTDLQPDYLNRAMESGRALRLLDGRDGGDDFTSLVCDTRGCYMIPETCPDKENAWSFLRLLLMEGQQLKDFDRRRICYPSNAAALNAVLDSYELPELGQTVMGLIDGAPVYTQESAGMERIFIESVQPYLYGDSDMDTALSIARGKLEIFTAEHSA